MVHTVPAPATQLSVVNLAARQRMLSQHTILQTLLAADGNADRLAAANLTFQLFCDSHAELMRTVKLMGPAHMPRIMLTCNGPVVAKVLPDITHEIDRQSKRAMELTRKSKLTA